MVKLALSPSHPEHALFVAANDTACAWGANESGQLGRTPPHMNGGDPDEIHDEPRAIHGVANVKQVAAGSRFGAVVTHAGELFMMGDSFAPGSPTVVQVPGTAFQVPGDTGEVQMVACGEAHTVVLTRGGRVFTFGQNEDDELGLGPASELSYSEPQCIPQAHFNGEDVVFVAAGPAKTMAVSARGNVYAWGRDGEGTLGIDDTFAGTPQQIARQHFDNEDVCFVALGENHSVAISTTGSVFTWGCDANGGRPHDQLGRGQLGMDNRNRPGRVPPPWQLGAAYAACGDDHTLVVTADGELWACGCNYDSELGMGGIDVCSRFRRVGAAEFGGTPVVAVAAGKWRSSVLLADCSLWIFGTCDGQVHATPVRKMEPGSVANMGAEQAYMQRVAERHPRSVMLGVAMGLHRRAGQGSRVFGLNDNVLRMIAGFVAPAEFGLTL